MKSLSERNYHPKWQQIATNATFFFILNTIHQSTEKRHQSNFVSNSIKVWFKFLIYAWCEFTILRNWQVPKSRLLILWMVIIRNKQSFYKIVSEEKLMDEKINSFQRNLGIYSLKKWDGFCLQIRFRCLYLSWNFTYTYTLPLSECVQSLQYNSSLFIFQKFYWAEYS